MAKIAFLFSGQGAQYPGMMKDICEKFPEAKDVFSKADKILQRGISEICFSGEQEQLNLTHNTQPCMIAAELAAYKAVTACGIKPDVVAGFSLGEYAALVAAGVMTEDEAIKVIQIRADAMQDAVPVGEGAMVAIMGQDEATVSALCEEAGGYAEPANYNSPVQIVVSGETKAVDKIVELCAERKIKAVKLPVSAPFHCKMMEKAAAALQAPFEEINFKKPQVPVYMNVDASPEMSEINIPGKLIMQAKSPVRWMQSLKKMKEDGIDTFIEIGPGKTLSVFVKKTLEDVNIFRVENMETLEQTAEAVKNL